jgi:hypothetical protein
MIRYVKVYNIEANLIGMFPSVGDVIYISSTVYQDHSVIGPFKVIDRGDCQVRNIIPSFIRATLMTTEVTPDYWVYPGRKVGAEYPCEKAQAKAWADYEADLEAHQG